MAVEAVGSKRRADGGGANVQTRSEEKWMGKGLIRCDVDDFMALPLFMLTLFM